MKYVVLKETRGHVEREIPVIFPNQLCHSDIAELVSNAEGVAGTHVVAAGFCNVSVKCSGNSESLNIGNRASLDDDMINTYDYTHGIASALDMPPAVQKLFSQLAKGSAE